MRKIAITIFIAVTNPALYFFTAMVYNADIFVVITVILYICIYIEREVKIVLYRTVPSCTVLYCTVLYYTALCYTVLLCTVLRTDGMLLTGGQTDRRTDEETDRQTRTVASLIV